VFNSKKDRSKHGVNLRIFVAYDGDEAIKLLEQIETSALPCPALFIVDMRASFSEPCCGGTGGTFRR